MNRVLRPGGEFLLEVLEADAYVHTAFPIIGAHGYFGPNNAVALWRDMLQQAGFEVTESGHVPGTCTSWRANRWARATQFLYVRTAMINWMPRAQR